MKSTTCSIIGLVLAAALAAGCKDSLPTENGTPTTGTIFYTGIAAPWPVSKSKDVNFAIYSVNADGTSRRQLTTGVLMSNPQGNVMAFARNYGYGNNALWALHRSSIDGSGERGLGDANMRIFLPILSPTKAQVAYTVDDSNLYVVEMTNSDPRLLATDLAHESPVAISLDGNWVAYYKQGPGPYQSGNEDVMIVKIDGSEKRAVAFNGGSENDFESGIGWTPDGRLMYMGTNPDGTKDIYIVDINGGTPRNVTNDMITEGQPTLSPDGTKIAYAVSNRRHDPPSGTSDIWVVNIDGSGKRNFTNTAGLNQIEMFPDWSPDSRSLLYSTFNYVTSDTSMIDGGVATLYVHDLGSSRPRAIAGDAWRGFWGR